VLQEGNGKLKGKAALVVPTSGDHHEPHEIVGPLSACTLVTDGNLKSLHRKRSIVLIRPLQNMEKTFKVARSQRTM